MKAFTLLELLVSISIMFLLAALLATSTARAKVAAQRALCLNNARALKTTDMTGVPIIFGDIRDLRTREKMRLYDPPIVVVNCYVCHPFSGLE